MSRFCLLLILIITMKAFAFPCPNGGGLFYKGDSVEEVIRQCGQPTSKKSTSQSLYSLKKLTYINYYPNNLGFLQMELIFTNDKVSRIHMTDRNYAVLCRSALTVVGGGVVTSQASCGDWVYDLINTNCNGIPFGLGETIENVKKYCGNPAREDNLGSQGSESTEIYYGNHKMIFQNGKLVDWN